MNIISWSGGKDSTATVTLAHEMGIEIDLIIMSVVWFDKARGIYGDNPEHIKWCLEYAKPIFESWGYKVVIVSSEKDYLSHFNYIVTRSKVESRNGKKRGWLIGGLCKMNGEKVNPIRKYIKSLGECVQYIGIAIDESERLKRLHNTGNISLLEQCNYTEQDAYNKCLEYNLLSPTYQTEKRGGCWFCPNQSIKGFADLKKNHPELWNELVELDKDKNKISDGFKYGKTFQEVAEEVEEILNPSQLSIFNL